MRNMSFSLTTPQMRAGAKDVTRRVGWANLKAGDRFMAVEKGMGLKKGETVVRIGECVVVSNTPEPVTAIASYPDDCRREGFPLLTPAEFVAMFCGHMRVEPSKVINRIEFKPVAPADDTHERRRDAGKD